METDAQKIDRLLQEEQVIIQRVRGIQKEFDFDAANLLMDKYREGEVIETTVENLQEAIDAFIFVYAIIDILDPERIEEKVNGKDERRDPSKHH